MTSLNLAKVIDCNSAGGKDFDNCVIMQTHSKSFTLVNISSSFLQSEIIIDKDNRDIHTFQMYIVAGVRVDRVHQKHISLTGAPGMLDKEQQFLLQPIYIIFVEDDSFICYTLA